LALRYFVSFYLFSNILKFFLTNYQSNFIFLNTTARVKDGSGALLWVAFFWQAIKSGNEQPDPQLQGGTTKQSGGTRPNYFPFSACDFVK
jgi:hypothetical protein